MRFDYWKVVMVISIMAFIFLLYINFYPKETYDFGNFKIEKETFDKIGENIPYEKYVVCDIDNNKCIIVNKMR